MRVLVPVDGSRHSTAGLKVAAHFAKTKGAAVYIMTVVPYISDIDLEFSASEREKLIEGMRESAEEILAEAKGLMESYGAPYIRTVLSVSTSAAEEIAGFAEKENADLIIIGRRGKGAAEFLLGSVSSNVVRLSPCCVYVAKEEPLWV